MLGLPLAETLTTRHLGAGRLAATGGLSAAIAAAYVSYDLPRDTIRREMTPRRLEALCAAILGASCALVFVGGPDFDYGFVYALWPAMALDRTRRLALPALLALAVVVGLLGGITIGTLVAVVIVLLGAGAAVAGVTRLVEANVALERARQEEASLAVAEERLRFARDLHELLGHSLSLIALKAEVAARLLGSQPQRAAEELEAIGQVTRRALQEVRDAVGGYRQPSLAGELANARQALGAAGIACEEHVELSELPRSLEAPLAWALREAVTNVVRHAGARCCRIELSTQAGWTTLSVADDGRGLGDARSRPARAHTQGNGLAGVAERLGGVGGRLEVGPGPTCGFVLRASIPVGDAGDRIAGARGAGSPGAHGGVPRPGHLVSGSRKEPEFGASL